MVAAGVGLSKKEEIAVARFVDHPSFREKRARMNYGHRADNIQKASPLPSHIPDEVTRELAKGMHYAAYRLREAGGAARGKIWRQRYVDLRNQIVLGNRKLIFRAVHARVRDLQLAEDCAAECHIVMIRAAASYNPWLGIRFSTYAFTCLLRELTRLVQRQMNDRLRQAASFDDALFDDAAEPVADTTEPDGADTNFRQFFAAEHRLLSDREKQVLSQRFGFDSDGATAKLKEIGSSLNISKERVRQLQNSGLEKLRDALATDCTGV